MLESACRQSVDLQRRPCDRHLCKRLTHTQRSEVLLAAKDELSLRSSGGTNGAMAVFDALRRRGLALCFANLIHWPNYERYLNTLFNHLHREAKPGYMKCTIRQLVEADRLCWSRLIEQNVKPRPNPGDPLPLDSKLQATLESYDVSFELMPLPQQPPKRKER